MKVLIVSTSETTGGAAVAANRLMKALNNNGVKARMMVAHKETDDISVVAIGRRMHRWHFLWERLCIYVRLHFRWDHLFQIDIANSGTDITRLREFREADVVHLHWINQGMLSLKGIRRILASGKPVVWTMHDLWPATAICHLALGCRSFTESCHHCKYLPGGGSEGDLAARVWRRKERMLGAGSCTFVACSRWLEGEARASALLEGQKVMSIPNPIDTHVFCPGSQGDARRRLGLPEDRLLMLFVCQRLTNVNKGMSYLAEACRLMADAHPELKDRIGLVLLGGHADEVSRELPFDCFPMGYVSDEATIVDAYRASDVFVLPSLSENLPNTIMEAMACGVPCVGFRVGGIPEMIDHRRNGYVAELRNSDDLARGLLWVLTETDRDELRRQAQRKVNMSYSQSSVALRYIEVYQEALAQKHLNL